MACQNARRLDRRRGRRVRRAIACAAVALVVLPCAIFGIAAAEPSLATDGEPVVVERGPGQVIEGESSLPPGARVTITVELASGSTSFANETTAVVDRTGSFRTVLDLSAVSSGTEGTVTVDEGGETATAEVHVTGCGSDCITAPRSDPEASFEPVTLEAGPGQVVEGKANLPAGQQVAVTAYAPGTIAREIQATVAADGTVRATFDGTRLAEAVGEEVTFVLRTDRAILATTEAAVEPCRSGCPPDGTGEDQVHVPDRDDLETDLPADGHVILPVDLAGAESATVGIAGGDGFEIVASVTPGTDADRVDIVFNAGATERRAEHVLFPANHRDQVVIERRSGPVTPGEYVMAVAEGPANEWRGPVRDDAVVESRADHLGLTVTTEYRNRPAESATGATGSDAGGRSELVGALGVGGGALLGGVGIALLVRSRRWE